MNIHAPLVLWNCIREPEPLHSLGVWFLNAFRTPLVGDDGKLLFPLCRRVGFRFSRTAVQGISVCKHGGSLYSLYESQELYEGRRTVEDWQEFLSAGWQREIPLEPGLYFVRSREGYQSIRQLVQLPTGQLHDVSGGFVQPGRVTTWQGDWWSKRIPLLRGAR